MKILLNYFRAWLKPAPNKENRRVQSVKVLLAVR